MRYKKSIKDAGAKTNGLLKTRREFGLDILGVNYCVKIFLFDPKLDPLYEVFARDSLLRVKLIRWSVIVHHGSGK